MATAVLEEVSLYREFRRLCEEDLLPKGVRACALIFFLLQTFIFIPADWLFFPEHFAIFLPARLVLNVLLVGVYLGTAERQPMPSLVAGVSAGAFVLLMMVDATGGSTSGYYVGLILMAIGQGVLLPLSSKQCISLGMIYFLGYAALPLYNSDPVVLETFVQHLFFLGTAVLEGAFACHYMDRLRFADFKQQRELERARDELRKLDQAKSRFSANVHHELRTPLTLILAPLDALRSGDYGFLSLEVTRSLDTMYSNGRRLLKMINDLLDLSKVESEGYTIHRRSVDFQEIVSTLVAGAQPLAEQKRIKLTMQGFEDLPVVFADPDAIEKIMVNLVGNAIKFTEPEDSILASARSTDEGIRISVCDTGLGIPQEKISTIFDRFAQVDSSATRRHEGTGIGLSLARELVELHGGRIWGESEGEGHGTTMIFDLPLGEPDEESEEGVLVGVGGDIVKLGDGLEAAEADLGLPSSESIDLDANGVRWERQRVDREEGQLADRDFVADGPEVVIAEDNPDMRSLLKFLVGHEFRVRTARNGREALEMVQECEPSLVLSDVMMPEMSGIDLCRAIKADANLAGLPVMLVTSKAESEMQIEGLEEGADDYVTKPFHPRELMARVRALVSRRELQQELAEQNRVLEQAMNEIHHAEVRLVQAERLSAVGELAAGVAHEINNPVNFAVNAARALATPVGDLLRRLGDARADVESGGGIDDEELVELKDSISELLGIITDGLSRTHGIVSKLRDFAAPTRGQGTFIDPGQGLQSTIDLLAFFLSEAGVTVELALPDELPGVDIDSGALNQVFLNLVKNAAESMKEEGGVIAIDAAVEEDTVNFRIRDQGTGLSAEAQEKLFEPFFTTKEDGQGTGLGLSISRQIAESNGGCLELSASSAEGSVFQLSLPIARLERETHAS
jgi:signal transduction histidine kinase